MILTGLDQSTWKKLRPNSKLYTKIPTWICLGSDSHLRGYSPATGLNHSAD